MKELNSENKYSKMKQFLENHNQPSYRFKQITHAIFQQRIGKFDDMDALPKTIRSALAKEFGEHILTITPLTEQTSSQVKKVLFEVSGKEKIETANMQFEAGWESFCISSQCGCNLGCKFCATGDIGLRRNLSADEITDQVLYFYLLGHTLDSISFMGMGEALANSQVFNALEVFTNPDLFGLSPRRISVSTVGIIPNIKKMTYQYPQINLTFSLHSPFNEQRSVLMPINNKFPLNEVMETLDEHIQVTGRKVYIAYIMLHNVNDSIDHAKGIVNLIKGRIESGRLYHINIIRYNPTVSAPVHYEQSDERKLKAFYNVLKSSGINATIRSQFGIDIDAACGQLYGNYQNEKLN